jgi:hypothetical protein
MINYKEIYKQVVKATIDKNNGFYNPEINQLVSTEVRRIGLNNPELRAELNLEMARRNIADLIGLTWAGREEFEDREVGLNYETYLGIANRLLPQEDSQPALV